MKYPCNIIKDLLPLYHDGVCSQESADIITDHFVECSACQAYYQLLCSEEPLPELPKSAEEELKKAASFRAIRNKLLKKQIIFIAACLLIICIAAAAVVDVLKNTAQIVTYDNNISVSSVNGDLIGRLSGSSYQQAKSLTVESTGRQIIFFYFQNSKWDEITTHSQIFAEYTICPAAKGAADIDAVYYYTGDYTGLENLSPAQLQNILDTATLLWYK